jgi:hypothetical protein
VSLSQIFQASVGIQPIKTSFNNLSNSSESESEPLFSLQLCCDCLMYFEKHAEKLVNIRKPLEIADIVKCLTRVVYFMLNC